MHPFRHALIFTRGACVGESDGNLCTPPFVALKPCAVCTKPPAGGRPEPVTSCPHSAGVKERTARQNQRKKVLAPHSPSALRVDTRHPNR